MCHAKEFIFEFEVKQRTNIDFCSRYISLPAYQRID